MTNLIDGRTPQDVLKLQKKHLDTLQKVPPGKPLLIKTIEGSTPDGQDPDLYGWRDFKTVWAKALEYGKPIYTRGIRRNEIVIDPDVNDWDTMKEQVGKLKACLDLHSVPYELAYSGGKACHLHIFFDTFDLDTDDSKDAKLYDVDPWKCVRETIVKELLKLSGADPEKMGLDWGKIRFDISKDINGRNGKGSQIREYGTTRPNGMFKTLVDSIPETKPDKPDSLPLHFPGQPTLWNISGTTFHQAVRDAFKAEVDRARVRNEYNLDGVTFEDIEIGQFPCYPKIKAMHLKNNRYYAAAGIGLQCKMCGYSREETGQILTDVLNTFEGLSTSDKQLRLDNSLKLFDTDKHFSCRKLKEMVGSQVCDFTRCPLKEKLKAAKTEESVPIDWKTPLKQAVMDTQDADPENQIKAARVILNNVLATMEPIARKETFLGKVCPELKISNRAANDIYRTFERNIQASCGAEWFNEKGKFVPPVLSEHIREHHHFVTLTDTKEIWVYDGKTGCYKPHGDVIIKQFAQDALGLSSKKNHIDEVVNHISIETFEDRGIFDSDPDLINLQNVYYNIMEHTFHEHSPNKKFTYTFPFKYNPSAKCPNFEKFLKSTGVDAKLIFEIFGYCLVPGYPIQSLMFFMGDGGNGKGTTVRVLEKFLGSENIIGHSMQALDKNKYAMADLFGKRANICGDMPPTEVRDTSPIKITTGGEPITAPVIYKGNITFRNSAKMIFLLNHLPEFDDNTDSWDRRPVYVEFNNRVMGKDAGFIEEDMWTEEELSGMFNKCLEVLPDLLKRGSFTGTKSIQKNREYRQRRSNPIGTFIEDCTNYDDTGKSITVNVYAAYLKWCTENNETCLTENVFGRKLLEKFPEFKKIRPRIVGVPTYCYSGFVLKEEYDGLNVSEESEKYEESKGYDTPSPNFQEFTESEGEVIQDTPKRSRHDLGMIQDKKSDFSATEATNEGFDLGCSSKLSDKKIISKTEVKKDDKKSTEKIEQVSRIKTEKEPIDSESILDQTRIMPRSNPDQFTQQQEHIIKNLLDKWEKHCGRIFAGNKIRAQFDIPKYNDARWIDHKLIFEAVDKRSKGRCLDCGLDTQLNEEVGRGYRCKSCHDVYSNPPPVVIPDEFSLEPAEVTP